MADQDGGTGELTLGVEEEYQIIDPESRALSPRALPVLRRAHAVIGEEVHPELRLSQIEIASPVCRTLADTREQVTHLRRELILAAERDGDRIAAAGTHPFSPPGEQPITPKARYRNILADYGELARELLIWGCHVHVGIPDPETGLAVMNRARIWLAPLLALTGNSPFWLGEDTGYASFRTELWSRWPMAGQPLHFDSRAEYDALVGHLVQAGVISDPSKIYWDIRLPARVPTVEFRVTDVCLTVDEAVMVAGLCRGLAHRCGEAERRAEPYSRARPELLRAAHWRAARYGLDGELIDVGECRSVPAPELIEGMLRFLRPSLEALDDWDEVSTLVREVRERGTGAQRQREIYARTGRMEAVVDYVVAETRRGVV